MKVVVCVKQIPDPASEYTLEPDSHWLVRPSEQVLDDTDRYGVEMGLQLAQASEDGSVTLVSMGPTGNMQGIRQALAMGADKAVVVDDTDLRGS
ncbi:MAG: electron transfer flavoprotein subunit alpha, partial [Acidimicrobiia bacterium]